MKYVIIFLRTEDRPFYCVLASEIFDYAPNVLFSLSNMRL